MAAGLGFKTFTTGEVLTAADVNGYLMQGVLVFASAAARDAAITSPQEGQACYLKDTDAVLTYSGTAWVGFDDSNAIQNAIINAKGDLIAGSANDTPAILAAGANGETLVADSSTSTGLRYSAIPGANLLANGSFDIWQRGTSGFSSNTSYSADRWFTYSITTATASRETSVVPTGATYALKVNVTGANGFLNLQYAMEQDDVIKLRGQVVTFSVYLRADATYNGSFAVYIASNTTGNTQTGGTWSAVSGASTSHTPSTSAFTRVAVTGTIPTNANGLAFVIGQNAVLANNSNYYIALAKAEIGSVATPWSRAGETLAGEFQACRRYYQKFGGGNNYEFIGQGFAGSTTSLSIPIQLDVPMRVVPTSVDFSTLAYWQGGAVTAITAAVLQANSNSQFKPIIQFTSTGLTSLATYGVLTNNSTSGYLAVSAEL